MPRTEPRQTNDSPIARMRIERDLTQTQFVEAANPGNSQVRS